MDADLEAIRAVRDAGFLHCLILLKSSLDPQKRMAELQAAGGGAGPSSVGGAGPSAGAAGGEDAAQRAAMEDERRRTMMSQILSPEARERRESPSVKAPTEPPVPIHLLAYTDDDMCVPFSLADSARQAGAGQGD